MGFFKKLEELYLNSGWIFDLIFTIVTGLILILLIKTPIDFLEPVLEHRFDALVTFLGILSGFLLTTFSLLFLYNPEHSENLKALRNHKAYKKMLHCFVSTAFFTFILVLFLLIKDIFLNYYMMTFLVFFVLLRILRCLCSLVAVISINQVKQTS